MFRGAASAFNTLGVTKVSQWRMMRHGYYPTSTYLKAAAASRVPAMQIHAGMEAGAAG